MSHYSHHRKFFDQSTQNEPDEKLISILKLKYSTCACISWRIKQYCKIKWVHHKEIH